MLVCAPATAESVDVLIKGVSIIFGQLERRYLHFTVRK
jgi:hypothetical protein